MAKQKTLIERFNALIEKTESCWLWRGNYNKVNGYGLMMVKAWDRKKPKYAHRMAYMLFNGPLPTNLIVRHSCDNKRCVNPEHLLLGTALDNLQDAVARGRHSHGARHPNAKLTAHDIINIRELALTGMTHESIANRFPVGRRTITSVLQGRNWRHVE